MRKSASPGGPGPPRHHVPVPWTLALLLASVLATADAFWLTSLQGALGAIDRSQEPFRSWLLATAVLLPVLLVVVVVILVQAARRYGPEPRGWRAVLTTGLTVGMACTAVAVVAVAASSAYDYRLQSAQLRMLETSHRHAPLATAVTPAHARADDCSTACLAQRATLAVHLRGVEQATVVILLTDVLLVGWVIALCGGRLERRSRRRAGRRG